MSITRRGQLTAETQFTGDFLTEGATAAVISSTKAKTGTFSYRHQTTTNPTGLAIPASDQIRAGFWLNHLGIPASAQAWLFRWISGSTLNGFYWDENDSLVRLSLNGSDVASVSLGSTNLNRNDTWMHVGLNVFANASGFASLYIDGIQVFNYLGNTGSNIDTLYFGGRIGGGSGWGVSAYFDDFYVDTATSESDVAPPSKRFLFSLVNAAGADAQWTPSAGSNFQNVDDSGVPDGDTTHNAALSASLKDTFNTASIAVPAGHEIRAAIILAIARRTDAGITSQIKLHSYDGSTYQSGAAQTPSVSYNTLWERQVLQPDGAGWNETDFGLMQFGAESSGSF